MHFPLRTQYAHRRDVDALDDSWQLIQDWRDAVAEYQIARAALDAAETAEAVDEAIYRLQAVEARLRRLKVMGAEAHGPAQLLAEQVAEQERRLDGFVGRLEQAVISPRGERWAWLIAPAILAAVAAVQLLVWWWR